MLKTKLIIFLFFFTGHRLLAMTVPTPSSPINNVKVASFAVSLTVNNISTASGYQFEIDSVNSFNSPLHLKDSTKYYSYYVYDLKPGTKYYWRARAYKSGDTSAWSVISSFIDSLPSAVNSTPANNSSGPMVKIYGNASGATTLNNFQYEADTVSTFNSPLHTITNISNNNVYIDSNLFDYARNIFWRVRVIGKYGDTTLWSPVWKYTILRTANANTPWSGTLNTTPQYTVGWPASFYGVAGTEIVLDTTPNFNSVNMITHTQPAGVTADTMRNLKFGKLYYYRIRNFFNGKYSDWSSTFNIKINSIVNFNNPSFNGMTNFTLNPNFSWASMTGARFQFQFAKDAQFTNLFTDTFTWSTNYPYLSYLNLNTMYYIRVRACHAADTSVWTTYNFTTTNGKPYIYGITDKQTNVTVRPHIYFRKEAYASKYIMEFDTGTVYTAQHSSWYIRTDTFNYDKSYYHFIDTSLAYNQQYFCRLTLIKGQDTSAPLMVTFKTAAAPVNYYPPNNFIGLGTSSNGLVTGMTGSTFIQWEIDTTSKFNSPLDTIGTDKHIPDDFTPQYVGISLPAYLKFHTKYYWRTRCINPVDTGEWSTPFSFLTTQEIWVISPADKATNQPVNPVIEWGIQGSTNYLRYQFMLSTDSNFTGAKIVALPEDSSSAARLSCAFATTYYWKARAYNPIDTSHWSATFRFTTIPLPVVGVPALLSPSNGAKNIPLAPVSLVWTSSANAVTYEAQAAYDVDFTSVVAGGTTSATSIFFTGVLQSTRYYWRVRGIYNDNVKSNWSQPYWFETIRPAGIEETLLENSLALFPNPADEHLQIKTAGSFNYSLTDIQGKLLLSGTGEDETMLSVENLPSGVYTLTVKTEMGTQHRKVLVTH